MDKLAQAELKGRAFHRASRSLGLASGIVLGLVIGLIIVLFKFQDWGEIFSFTVVIGCGLIGAIPAFLAMNTSRPAEPRDEISQTLDSILNTHHHHSGRSGDGDGCA